MKYKYISYLFLCLCINCKAQQRVEKIRKDVPFTENGYLINLYGETGVWIFQPCEDSSIYVLEAINGTSFFVQDMPYHYNYTNLIDSKNLGKKIITSFYDRFFHKKVLDTLRYLYCRATIVPLDNYKKSDSCDYLVNYKGQDKGLSCISLTSTISVLEPLDSEDRKKYIEMLRNKKRPLPKWAE